MQELRNGHAALMASSRLQLDTHGAKRKLTGPGSWSRLRSPGSLGHDQRSELRRADRAVVWSGGEKVVQRAPEGKPPSPPLLSRHYSPSATTFLPPLLSFPQQLSCHYSHTTTLPPLLSHHYSPTTTLPPLLSHHYSPATILPRSPTTTPPPLLFHHYSPTTTLFTTTLPPLQYSLTTTLPPLLSRHYSPTTTLPPLSR
jgi:hypothetical protein